MRMRRILSALLCAVLLMTGFAVQAKALPAVDPEKKGTLEIQYQHNGTALEGAAFEIYHIADMSAAGKYELTEDFKWYTGKINSLNEWELGILATTLEGRVLRDNIAPVGNGETDSRGELTFDGLAQGMYLIISFRHVQDGKTFTAQPWVVCLPYLHENGSEWVYDLTMNPKFDLGVDADGHVVRRVLKTWDDKGNEEKRPQEVTIQLLQDGNVYDTVVLNAECNWRHTWMELDSASKWNVVEVDLDDYKATVTREGITFVVKNTYKQPGGNPPDPNLPQTGQLWWPVPALIAGGLLLMLFGMVRRRGAEYEEEE